MNYKQTLSLIYGLERFGVKLGLGGITNFLQDLGNPHLRFPSIHIAGTNGKGSTAAMLESILCFAGYKTGLYTSPHLVSFRERIRICGREIDEKSVVLFVSRQKKGIAEYGYTFFEVITALAFKFFSDRKIEIAVLETGLGGRLDATNVVRPEISLITSIALEHTEILGKTVSQIAFEKGGIIKGGVPVISAVEDRKALQVLKDICSHKKSLFVDIHSRSKWKVKDMTPKGMRFDLKTDTNRYEDLRLNLIGEHQVQNAVVAVNAIELLREKGWNVTPKDIYGGLERVSWRGRFQILPGRPLVILDVAHNPDGIDVLLNTFDHLFGTRKVIFVFGVLRDKNCKEMLRMLSKKAKWLILTKPDYHRAQDLDELEVEADELGIPHKSIAKVKDAYSFGLKVASKTDILCVTGSHFTVGEVLEGG